MPFRPKPKKKTKVDKAISKAMIVIGYALGLAVVALHGIGIKGPAEKLLARTPPTKYRRNSQKQKDGNPSDS
jgi:hypothetical protein